METINDRFRSLRECLGLSQEEFAKRANRTRSEIKNIEYEKTVPKDEVIKSVCLAHHASEVWLRTGEGEMLRQVPEGEALAAQLGQLLRDVDADFKRRLISELLRLPPEAWPQIEAFARRITSADEEKEETGQ